MKLVTSLASKPSMVPLRLTLLARLWRVESRCYPFLQKAPLEPTPSTSATEYQITQAAVIRDTESIHATQYGSDLLPSLSNLLNQCNGPGGTTLRQAMQYSGTEHVNYNHLPKHSMSRGLVGAIITAATTKRELPRHQLATHSDKSGITDLATMLSEIKAALEKQTVPEANQLVLSQALEPLVCPAADYTHFGPLLLGPCYKVSSTSRALIPSPSISSRGSEYRGLVVANATRIQ